MIFYLPSRYEFWEFRLLKPDAVIVLDATYANKKQGIELSKGGVITVSDKSVILSPSERNNISDIFRKSSIPIQFEVYNYSGTDAKSFPMAGLDANVIALLVPTKNNHSPNEICSSYDIKNTIDGVKLLAKSESVWF